MRANGSGTFEASGIINGRLEISCRNRANARNSHHPQADVIIAGRTFDPPIQGKIVLYIATRAASNGSIAWDNTSSTAIKGRTRSSKLSCWTVFWKAQSEDLQQPANLICQVHGCVEQGFAAAQQNSYLLVFKTLHMNRAEPPHPQYLRNPSGIVAIGLFAHLRQHCTDLSGFQADNV